MSPTQSQQGISSREIIATFVSVTGFLSTVVTWLDFVQHGQEGYQNFLWAGIVIFIVFWGIILYLLYKQKNIYLNIWLAVTVVAIAVAGVGWISYKRADEEKIRVREEKIIVLIASFDDAAGDSYGLRNEIIEKLTEDFAEDDRVLIETVDEIINPGSDSGSNRARELGESIQADVVIWGWYRPTKNPNITIHIENLNPEHLAALKKSETLQPNTTLVELESFTFQQQTGKDASAFLSFLVGFVEFESNDYENAITRFSRAIADKTDNAQVFIGLSEIYFYRGSAYFWSGKYKQAIQDYDRSIEIAPQEPRVYANRGFAYFYIGQFDLALQDASRAIQIDPNFIEGYSRRGFIYNILKKYDLAIQDFDQVVENNPQDYLAYHNRSTAYVNLGQYEKAIEDINHAIEIEPSLFFLYYSRGAIYEKVGNYELAIKDIDWAIKNGMQFPFIYSSRGNAYAGLGQYEQALHDFNFAIDNDPRFAIAYYDRGLVYEKMGNTAKANADFAKYKELTGQDAP